MPSSPHEFFKVFLLYSDYRPSVDRPSTERWPITDRYIGEVSTNYRRSVGEVSVKYQWTKSYIDRDTSGTTIDRVSTECRPTIVRVSTDYQPTIDRYIDRVSTDYRPTIDRVSTYYRPSVDRLSTAIATDRSVDTTYVALTPQKPTISTHQYCSPPLVINSLQNGTLYVQRHCFFKMEKQLHAIHFFVATCNVCPLAIP